MESPRSAADQIAQIVVFLLLGALVLVAMSLLGVVVKALAPLLLLAFAVWVVWRVAQKVQARR